MTLNNATEAKPILSALSSLIATHIFHHQTSLEHLQTQWLASIRAFEQRPEKAV